MSLMQQRLGRGLTVSPRRRLGSLRPRTFPVLVGLVSLALAELVVFTPSALAYARSTTINVLPQLNTTVSQVGSTFNAVTSLGGQTTSQPIGLSTTPNLIDPTCPILNLQLNAIHLSLLGLNVDTSNICLSITAHQGGGLLGDLLCGLANALDLGALDAFLATLTQDELTTLLDGLSGIINGGLGAVTTTGAPGTPGASTLSVLGTTPGACDILNLSLGPIDLTLLGLEVYLDNCAGGPVTVDITAVPAGGLLGQLLCALDNLLNNGANGNAILSLLYQITRVIGGLL